MPVPDFTCVLKMLYTRPFISVAQIKDLSWKILRTRVPDFVLSQVCTFCMYFST